jgi:hypothetical protein
MPKELTSIRLENESLFQVSKLPYIVVKGSFEYWNSIKIEPAISQMKGGDVNLRDVNLREER